MTDRTWNTPRYQLKTIRKFMAHLAELGLSVYGGNVDVDAGIAYPGCRDYDPEDIVKLRKLLEEDAIVENRE